MLHGTFTLITSSFHRLFVPSEREPLRRYQAVVKIDEIPVAWANWLEVNARESSDKGKVPKAIRQTLTDRPEWFAEYNRGLTIVADKVTYEPKSKELRVEFKDRNFNGVLDGGHTLKAIFDHLADENQAGLESYCNIEFSTGLEEEEISGVVEARNTSKQVTSKSLMNLDGKFEDLKKAIGLDKAGLISWKENEDGEFDIRELVGLMTAMNADEFTGSSQPIIAYSGKEACLNKFNDQAFGPSYDKLLCIAPDLLEMWDKIQFYLPGQYNQKGPEPGTGGKFGRLSGVKLLKGKKRKRLPSINQETDYDIPSGYIYPVFAAFRAMLEEKNGFWVWGKGLKPQDLIEEGVATDWFIESVRESIGIHHNPNRTGKDRQAWTNAYQGARIYYLEQG